MHQSTLLVWRRHFYIPHGWGVTVFIWRREYANTTLVISPVSLPPVWWGIYLQLCIHFKLWLFENNYITLSYVYFTSYWSHCQLICWSCAVLSHVPLPNESYVTGRIWRPVLQWKTVTQFSSICINHMNDWRTTGTGYIEFVIPCQCQWHSN